MGESRIVFLGTGEIAIPAFRFLIDGGPRPVGLVTQPDRPAGRKREPSPPPIKRVALEAGVPVLQPERIRDDAALEEILGLAPDLLVVMAYGQILPKALIGMAPLGCVNLHASLLPKYRGAACIQAAIDAGDERTGVSLMHVVPKLDAGDVILARACPILPDDTGGSVHERLALVGAEVLREGLPLLLAGRAPRKPQDGLGQASHVPKLERDDGRIDWTWPAERIARRLRAYDPWPGCWTCHKEGAAEKRLKCFPAVGVSAAAAAPGELVLQDGGLRIGCGDGSLIPGDVQAEGGRRMPAIDWVRGLRTGGPPRLY